MSLLRSPFAAVARTATAVRAPSSQRIGHLHRSLMSSSSSSPTSSLPAAGPRVPSPSIDEADAICKSDYIHLNSRTIGQCAEPATFSTLAPQPAASTPPSLTFAAPTATTASSSSSTATIRARDFDHSAYVSADAESLRLADEEYVLGLFGVQRPDDAAVQQRRQQLSADQQTASQFAGSEGRESSATSPAPPDVPAPTPTAQPAELKKNKASTKAAAHNDRHQGEFDQSGQRISRMSTSQSVKQMEEAKHRQAEQNRELGEQGGNAAERERESDEGESKKQQQAPPQPLDHRRPGGEVKDGAAPWSE